MRKKANLPSCSRRREGLSLSFFYFGSWILHHCLPYVKQFVCTIPMSDELFKILKEHEKYSRTEIVFCNKNGDYIDPSTLLRNFQQICSKSGIDRRVCLHDIRHTFASLAIMGGVPIPEIQAMLGHEDANMLLNIYTHLMNRNLDNVTTYVDGILRLQ